MGDSDWRWMGAAALGREIGAGRIDPVALCERFLDVARSEDAESRIYARLMPDRALAQAEGAAARAVTGARRGALDGVPVSWKDNIDIGGVSTEAGSALLAGRKPARDAAVVASAQAAGLVGLGKTHMSELAFAGLGYNPVTATPPNVNDPHAVPGGSSSGAAASVAFGLAAAAVGSDTGGSVRVPAAWNDLVGMKPAHGGLSAHGVVPLCARFDVVGPLARNVEDVALMLAALGGPRVDLRGADLSGVRLAVLESVALDDVDPVPARGFETMRSVLERAGARLLPLRVPELAEAMALSGPLYTGEAWGLWGDTISANQEVMYDRVRVRFEAGAQVSASEYVAAWATIDRIRKLWKAASAGFDAVILPTVPNAPPARASVAADSDFYVAENLRCLRNTRIGNLMGLAALTLPTQEPSAGLMLMAQPGSEARLLRLGAAAEAAKG